MSNIFSSTLLSAIKSLSEMAYGSHYYDPPEGFKKPSEYPGLVGSKHEQALNKGIVDLRLVDPDDPTLESKKKRAAILRNVVKLLIRSKGETVRILDPEWVLKNAYPNKMVKDVLKKSLEEALEAMFEKSMKVLIQGSYKKSKAGWSWMIAAPGLKKVLE